MLFKILASFCHQIRKSGLPALDVNRFQTLYVILGRAAGVAPRLHTQLTIRSSRARFAVSDVPSRIARAGLTQALAQQVVAGLGQELNWPQVNLEGFCKYFTPCSSQKFFSQERFSGQTPRQFRPLACPQTTSRSGSPRQLCALTIHSSRHRFAAPAKAAKIVPYRRRKAVRLNSGVRPSLLWCNSYRD